MRVAHRGQKRGFSPIPRIWSSRCLWATDISPAHCFNLCVCLVPMEVKNGHHILWNTVLTVGFEPPCGCWNLKPDPLQNWPVLQATSSDYFPYCLVWTRSWVTQGVFELTRQLTMILESCTSCIQLLNNGVAGPHLHTSIPPFQYNLWLSQLAISFMASITMHLQSTFSKVSQRLGVMVCTLHHHD